VGAWTASKAYPVYKYYSLAKTYYPEPIERRHFLIVDVINENNLTMDEEHQKVVIVSKGSIYFYTPMPGQNVTQAIEATNPFPFELTMTAEATGDIAKFLTYQAPKSIAASTKGLIPLTLSIPENATLGRYIGNFTITLERKKT